MVLLTLRGRRRLQSCCLWTLLLWIICAVDAEEHSFNVEVMSAQHSNKAAIMSSSRYSQDAAPGADGRAHVDVAETTGSL